ncbi:MAG: hypothetical protein GY758_09070 [Fuerstiella sp.]|nr:hypothetical protein [Fuerstiella sp.]MCP4506669.1 hypothetical protein [Fuerstiella sp.]
MSPIARAAAQSLVSEEKTRRAGQLTGAVRPARLPILSPPEQDVADAFALLQGNLVTLLIQRPIVVLTICPGLGGAAMGYWAALNRHDCCWYDTGVTGRQTAERQAYG